MSFSEKKLTVDNPRLEAKYIYPEKLIMHWKSFPRYIMDS